MSDKRCRLGPDDVIVGLDLASQEHQVVVLDSKGRRLTRFRIPHSISGLKELLDRTVPGRLERVTGERVFCFEATGHVWEAVAAFLEARRERYAIVNPLATFRVREARQLNRHKTDLTDAEQIAELARTGVHTRTQLESDPYMTLRRTWGEFTRLRLERARLKTLLTHQLYGLFPELVGEWADVLAPGSVAVLRTGLTPFEIATLTVPDFVSRGQAATAGRRVWRFKLVQVHEKARKTVACQHGVAALSHEVTRLVARIDFLTAQLGTCAKEVKELLAAVEESRFLMTIPGVSWRSAAGILAHVGSIEKYRHGRQLIKLAGTNPSRRDSGQTVGSYQAMSHRGRAGLREVVYMATLSGLQHNPLIRAHYDRLIQRTKHPLPKMKALGACMNKLLLMAFAVMKRKEAFDPSHVWTGNMKNAA